MPNIRLTIPVTPPGTMGTTQGGHIYLEAPDVSASATARMDGVTIMDGSYVAQADWAPIDLGKVPYVAVEQPWVLDLALPDGINPRVVNSLRVYVSSYSDAIDTPLVRYGEPGATPSVVVSLAAAVAKKPASATHVTPHLVTSISATVDAAVTVSGKLRRPIDVTTDLSGMGNRAPANWGYRLLGYVNGDLTTDPVLASGIITDTTGGLIPAGPDGISTAHTFGPEEPTAVTSITIYAVAGIIASDRYTPRGSVGLGPPGTFTPNNIVPGITASCVVTIGTTTGVLDMASVWLASTSAEFHVDPTTGKFTMNEVDFTKAKAGTFSTEFIGGGGAPLTMGALIADKIKTGVLEVGGADTGGNRVSRFKVFDNVTPTANLIGWIGDDSAGSGFVGAWFKRILIGGTSPATAKIVADSSGNVSISGTLIAGNISGNAANITGSLAASQIAAGTIAVAISLTSPTISVTGPASAWTINIDSTNGMKLTKGSSVFQVVGTTTQLLQVFDGSGSFVASASGIAVRDASGNLQSSMDSTSVRVNNVSTGHGCILSVDGFVFVGTGVAFTGTLAAAIAAGKSVLGGIIMS